MRIRLQQQRGDLQNAEAQLQQARLELSYIKIYAPVTGIVMSRTVQIGTRASSGQQLLQIAETGNLWITANFKETQLYYVKPGPPVSVHVDALKRDFNGRVVNIGGATGSIASALPPENATGNYVKVIQRVNLVEPGHPPVTNGISIRIQCRR